MPWSQKVTTAAGIGPAHPSHPDHLQYYTVDGISLEATHAKLFKLAFNGEGETAALRMVAKSKEELR